MAGFAITTAASLRCPHGGIVSIQTTNTKTSADRTFAARQNDIFTIAGCPFTLPGPTPSPCVTVRWLVPDVRVRVNGTFTLSQGSTGLCLSGLQVPQGPVVVVSTQTSVSTR
jgi:hypothetical protein